MDWLEITIATTPEALDTLVLELENLGVEGVVINDEASIRASLDNTPSSWDFVDDEVFDRLKGATTVQFYIEDSAEGYRALDSYKAALPNHCFTQKPVCDEDWQNNWKSYFKPLDVGKRLLIVPAWEPIPQETDRVILRIEPQLAFGTGGHASTRMCLEELEKYSPRTVLDLGCGSGILSVAALLFGAESALCCDIAPDAAAVCHDNIQLNGLPPDAISAHTADILSGSTLQDLVQGRRYDVVFANIIADVIIPLAAHVPALLAPEGVFICSGIINGREAEVRAALEAVGLHICTAKTSDGWHMLAAHIN